MQSDESLPLNMIVAPAVTRLSLLALFCPTCKTNREQKQKTAFLFLSFYSHSNSFSHANPLKRTFMMMMMMMKHI